MWFVGGGVRAGGCARGGCTVVAILTSTQSRIPFDSRNWMTAVSPRMKEMVEE